MYLHICLCFLNLGFHLLFWITRFDTVLFFMFNVLVCLFNHQDYFCKMPVLYSVFTYLWELNKRRGYNRSGISNIIPGIKHWYSNSMAPGNSTNASRNFKITPGNSKIIQGHCSIIHGNPNISHGNHNIIYGNSNIAPGISTIASRDSKFTLQWSRILNAGIDRMFFRSWQNGFLPSLFDALFFISVF